MKKDKEALRAVNELFRASAEAGEDDRRVHTSCLVGNEDEIFYTFTCERGAPEVWQGLYDDVRGFVQKEWGRDIGPLENCWCVLSDDCGALPTPIPAPIIPIFDEWNALQQMVTCGADELRQMQVTGPFYQDALAIWKRLRISYKEAFDRVKRMVIAPAPKGQRYTWQDFVS